MSLKNLYDWNDEIQKRVRTEIKAGGTSCVPQKKATGCSMEENLTGCGGMIRRTSGCGGDVYRTGCSSCRK